MSYIKRLFEDTMVNISEEIGEDICSYLYSVGALRLSSDGSEWYLDESVDISVAGIMDYI